MTRKLFTLLIMFLTMVGNAVWAEGDGSQSNPYTGSMNSKLDLSGTQTIYMKDFTLEVSDGLAMEITGDITFVVEGECFIRSTGNSAAVKMIEGYSLTMAENSTGILRIDGGTQQAILGGNKNGGGGATWKIGAVNINGGTLYLLGDIGHNGNHESITMGGGIAFVEGTVTAGSGSSGILFQRPDVTEGDWYGDLFNDITITSPISGDIDGDGTVDNDDIHLDLNSHTLTIGEGNKIIGRRGQLDLSNGYISAYVVNYDANEVSGCAEQTNVPVDGWLYGPNTEFDIIGEDLTCASTADDPNGQHQFFGWVNTGLEEKKVVKTGESSTTPTTQPEAKVVGGTDNYQGEPIELKAAWAAKARHITVPNNKDMESRTLAAAPEGVITYGSVNSSDLPNGITFNNGTFSGKPNVTDFDGQKSKTFTVTVPITVEGITEQQEATITITVTNELPSLDDATIAWTAEGNNTRVYSGTVYSNLFTVTATNVDNAPMSEGVHYIVTYEYTKPNSSTPETNTKIQIKEAGQYKVTKIEVRTPEDGSNELAQGGPIENPQINNEDIIITVTQRPLYLQIIDQKIALGSSITSDVNSSTVRILDKENIADGLASNETGATITYSGSLTTTNPLNTVGTFSDAIEGSSIAIASMSNGADINNYKIAEGEDAIEKGDLTVYLDLSGDDVTPELTPDPTEEGEEGEEGGEGEDIYDATSKTFTFPYDGQSYTLSKLTVGQQEITLEESNVSYSYAEEENGTYTALTDGQEVKDAGWYKAKVSLNSTLYPNASNLEYIIHITPRDLNVTVADQTVKVGNVEQDPTITWDIVFDQSNNTNTITIADGDVVSGETVVFSNTEDALTLTTEASTAVTSKVAGVYESAITKVENLTLGNGESDNAFKAKNYELKLTAGTLTVIRVLGSDDDEVVGGEDKNNDDDLNDEDGNWDEGEVLFGLGDQNTKVTYDGQAHGIDYLYVKNGDDWVKVEGTLSVTYTSQETEDNDKTTNDGAVDAATYDVTITLTATQNTLFELPEGGYKAEITIEKAPLTITGTYTCDDISSASSFDASTSGVISTPYSTGVNNEDIDSFSGTFTLKSGVTSSQADAFEGTITASGEGFKASNYNITYNITLTITGEGGEGGEDDDKTELDPNGDDKDNTTGGDEGDDNEFPSDDDFILLSPSGASSSDVYDGQEHGLTILKIGEYTLREGTNYTIESYVATNNEQAGLSNGLPKHVNTYSAEITLVEGSGYKWPDNAESYTLTSMTINERPMLISFVSEVASEADLRDINKLVQYEPMAGDRGLVLYEQPIVEATISDVTELGNGHYRVTIDRESFTISNNEGNFYLSDYTIALDADGDDSGDYNVTDEDNDGTGGLDDGDGSGDGDITIDVTIDPNKPNFPDFGGSGIHKPIEYYNIYIDTVCPGIKLELSKDVVKGGNEVSVYLTIQSECDTTGMRFEYKRGLFGWWEDLKPLEDVQPGEYIIKNIYTDIYIRALDATMPDDATGLEEVEGVKAYAQDGNIYVYTPNRMPVWIVSMTGAVLRNEEQVGLQAYDRLTRGIYIVRVGEQVFKIRL